MEKRILRLIIQTHIVEDQSRKERKKMIAVIMLDISSVIESLEKKDGHVALQSKECTLHVNQDHISLQNGLKRKLRNYL